VTDPMAAKDEKPKPTPKALPKPAPPIIQRVKGRPTLPRKK
jgi:hypothetical protein